MSCCLPSPSSCMKQCWSCVLWQSHESNFTWSSQEINLKIAATSRQWVNTSRPRQNGRRFADDAFKRIFLDENVRISIKISLKFVPKFPINNNPVLVQIMAWRRSGDKPLPEPMMVSLLTHICVARPQWVKIDQYQPTTNREACVHFLSSVVMQSLLDEFIEPNTWWRHQMETLSALLAVCAGNSPVTGEFPAQRPVTLSFDCFFFYLRLNERLSKQWWGWWFETPSHPLWRYCNET